MPIAFRCSQCNQLLRVPDTAAGKNARCPKCQSLMTVPPSSQEEKPPPQLSDAFPPQPKQPGSEPAPPAAPQSSPAGHAASASPPFAPTGGQWAAGASPDFSPGYSGPPKPPASGNPFGDSGGSPFAGGPVTSDANPYASPGAGAFTHEPKPDSGFRPGLPWEQGEPGLRTWWETATLCMMQPSYAFSIMRREGGLGQPMGYCALGLTMGVLGQMVWYLPFIIVVPLLGAQQGNAGEAAAAVGLQIGWQIFVGVMTVVLGATIGLLIGAAIVHVCLLIVGGARYDFETTLRVLGYANGATSWLNVIPCVGGLVAAIWLLVIEIIGLARAHETTVGKALLAVFLPIIVCFGALIAIIVVVGGIAALQ